jgi:outer membrane protein assembly factor BamB/predicted MPP superfamily phosphohydrolase
VSDGLSVQSTGDDGRFRLPGWGHSVWVCPSAEWTCSRWWIPKSRSSPEFVLTRSARPDAARIAHVSDLHLASGAQRASTAPLRGPVLHSLAGAIRNSRADLIVATGDITDRGTEGELKGAIKALKGVGVPFRLLPGDHDHYGHLDEPRSSDAPAEDVELGSGTFARWEEIVGPRWWSLNLGPLHLVALDWFSARTGADRDVQLRWLAADLALLPPGQPVVLLSHDQPNGNFLQLLKRMAPSIRLVGVLSGHWHAPGSLMLNRTLHLSTGPALMPGRDWSPPHFRLVSWNGSRLSTQTLIPAGAAPPRHRSDPPKWAFETRVERAHSLHIAVHPEGIVAATANHDRASGVVALIGGTTGKVLWAWKSSQPVASSVAVGPDGEVYLQTMAGTAARLDGGTLTWMVETPDPTITRVTTPPILAGRNGVLIEGPGFVRCLNRCTGRALWTRYVGDAESHYIHSAGRVCEGLAVLPLAGRTHGLTVLDPEDGAVVWNDEPDVARPKSPPTPLGDGTMVVVRDGGIVERLEVRTGRIRWRSAIGEQACGAAPVLVGEIVIVVSQDAAIFLLDSKTGWVLRVHRLPDASAPEPALTGPKVATAVLGAGRMLHLVTVSGEWWRLDPFHWEPERVASLPVAVSSELGVVGQNLVIPCREGYLLAASLDSLPRLPKPAAAGAKTRPADRWLRSIKLHRP